LNTPKKLFQLFLCALALLALISQGCGKSNVTSSTDSLRTRIQMIEARLDTLTIIAAAYYEKKKDTEQRIKSEPSDDAVKSIVRNIWLQYPVYKFQVLDVQVVGRDRGQDRLVVQCTAHVKQTVDLLGGEVRVDDYHYRVFANYKIFGGKWVLDGTTYETDKNQ
jgi:hypothetical protein